MTQHKTLADFCNEISQSKYKVNYESLKTNGIKIRILTEAGELYASQFIKKDDELNSAEKIKAIYNEMPESRLKDHLAKWFSLEKEVVSSDVETPISKAISEFERLKEKAPSIRDMVYLDGVLAVLDTMKDYESDFLIKLQSTQQPATINAELEKQNAELVSLLNRVTELFSPSIDSPKEQDQEDLLNEIKFLNKQK